MTSTTTEAPAGLSTDHSRAVLDGDHSHGGGVPDSSRADRLTSFDAEAFSIPTGREEDWRFSAIRDLQPLFAATAEDGELTWAASALPEGVTLTQIGAEQAQVRSVRAPGDRAAAVAVSAANGAKALIVAPGTVVADPITLDLTGNGAQARGHLLFEVGEGAQATIVVTRRGSATYSEFISVDVADGASLNLVLLQQWDDDAVHAGEVVARLGRDAHLRGSVATLGGKVVRLNTSAAFAGEGGRVDLSGLYFTDDGQHQEHQLFVDHAAPRCTSRVTYKGALAGTTARSVWIGDVLIRAQAEGTDTYELNRNLLLTDGARADSVPNLEIETGEIEGAGHASATGRFDDEQLFYLRARGIDEDTARRLVLRGFFAELIGAIGVPDVQARLLAAIDAELDMVAEHEDSE
ncbi:MAG: Fe-S cluster assembly protein SufD [Beutenbergiaceae bacterium]